jgi:hypothetical protein
MKQQFLYVVFVVCLTAAPAFAQYSNVSPTTTVQVKAADDFATRAFQDPWDMQQRTDVGWWTWGTDTGIAGNFVNPSVANGLFTGSLNGAAATLFLLDSGLQSSASVGQATPIGKTGQQYPIDATQYSHLIYRMSSTTGGVSQYVWSTNTIYDDQTLAFQSPAVATAVQTGWKIYDVDLTALTATTALGPMAPWTGTKRALQFIPIAGAPTGTIQINWVRLVRNDPTLKQNITWTGPAADIYIDSDNNPANGTLGRLAVNVSSGYNFFVAGLPAGTYYIAVHSHTAGEVAGSAGGFTYSAGSFVVNDIPTLQFTTPSAEGSSDDFATTKLGKPWDFTQITDVDSTLPGFSGTQNVVNPAITQMVLTNEAGVNLGPQTVYSATSVAAGPGAADPTNPFGNPQVFTLFWDGKGKTNRIDPTRYRILTVEAGVPNKARSLPNGSIGRVVWRAFNEPVIAPTGTKTETVGEHFILNSAAGENTVAKISIDMNRYPVEPHSLDVNTTWNSVTATTPPGIDGFRWNPHEFAPATPFFIKRVTIAALERTQADQFTFNWTLSKPATVTVFYDQDPSKTFTLGTQACTSAASAGAGSCSWNAAAVPQGEYQIYAVFTDGTNSNQVYALTNVIVDHTNNTQALNLNRTNLYYAQLGATATGSQIVRVTTSGPGIPPCWTATPNALGLLTISPTSACGSANLAITPNAGHFPSGTTTTLFVTIAPTGTQTWNSKNIAVNVTGLFSSTAPIGSFDTPADGSMVSGSVAVTGWAADDVQIAEVAICRDPVAGETTTPTLCAGQQQVFIANPEFIDDARPDIEAVFPTIPLNYRAGWGYLMLTNFLPNGGNGPVKLWAYAVGIDGQAALLGSKSITTTNAASTRPFGALDTPTQGGVACGTQFVNFGWALTQNGKDIPADSSTIQVFIDGAFVGHPQPRAPRADITGAFPNLDTTHAVGGFVIDTTQYSNGVHTIYWFVTDTGGQADGIGSRFFTVSNPCGS